MILRIWRGWADKNRPDDYPDHFRNAVVPELRSVPGFLGTELAKRILPDRIEFTVITRWASIDAIKAFAGDDIETAVVHADAAAALVGYDDRVEHHEVIERA